MDQIPQLMERMEQLETNMRALARRLDKLESALHPKEESTASRPLATPPPIPPRPKVAVAAEPPRQPDIPPRQPEPRPAPPPQPPPFTPEMPRPEPQWREVLRTLKLLPPSGEGQNIEIQIGTWWATRIGTLLAVIAVVFLGVYVAQYSRPWIRFVELTALAFGLTALGRWSERRYPKYGSVIFGGGLALIFFCAFGAHAVPAVKIIDSPSLGAALQFATAAGILACALWRGSPAVATMAVLCGYVACFFSFSAGLNNSALIAALALAVMGVFFYQARGWTAPIALSIPLTYLLYAVIFVLGWVQEDVPAFWVCHAWLLAYLGVFAAADLLALARGRLIDPQARRALHLFSSSAAVLLGFLVTRAFYKDQLSDFYFTYGAVLTALALRYYLEGHPDALMHGYFVKGSALVTMGLITALGGRTRWIALAVESFVLLFSARRSGLLIVRLAMGAAWLASWWYFVHQTHDAARVIRGVENNALALLPLASVSGVLSLLYLLLSALLLGLQGRWLGRRESTPEPLPDTYRQVTLADAAGVVFALALSWAILTFGFHYFPFNNEGLLFSLLLAMLAAVAIAARHWIPFVALVPPLLLAHARFWAPSPVLQLPPAEAWINGGALIALTAGAAVLIDRVCLKKATAAAPWLTAIGALHLLWMITLQALYWNIFHLKSPSLYLLLAVSSAALLAAVAASRFSVALLGDFSVVLILIAAIRLLIYTADTDIYRLTPAAHAPWSAFSINIFLILPLAWGFACAYVAWPRLARSLRLLAEKDIHPWVHGFAAFLVTLFVLAQTPGLHAPVDGSLDRVLIWVIRDTAAMLAFGLAALAVMFLARWPGFKPAPVYSMVLLLIAHRVFYSLVPAEGATLAAALGLGAVTLALAILPQRLRPDRPPREQRQYQWLCGVLTLVLCFWLFLRQRGELAHYTTACWGISSIVIFIAGLVFRAKPLRILGLAGLAICIPRVFIVDVRSTFYRIAATGVLGAVVLLVAFLYNKYRAVIEAWDNVEPPEQSR